jgi:diguanylate cyclase (GGDEF)-like protein
VDPKMMVNIANRLRVLVQESALPAGRETLRVTVSVGAAFARQDDTPESISKRADGLMYRSKKAGRNLVTAENVQSL